MPGPKKSAPRGKPWFVTMKDATLHGRLKFVRRKWLVVRLLDTCLCSTKPYGRRRTDRGVSHATAGRGHGRLAE